MKRHGQIVSEARRARHYKKLSREKRNEARRRAAVALMEAELKTKTPEVRAAEHRAAVKAHTKPPKKKGKG